MKNHERNKRENRVNQNGIVLILSLVFMGILALLGSTAVMLTTTDMKIGDNYKSNTQAFSAAQAGIAEALNRLNLASDETGYAGDTAATADPWWSTYILTSGPLTTADDLEYNANYQNYFPSGTNFTNTTVSVNTFQSTEAVNYLVKIKHKREYDAEQAGHTTTTKHYADGDGSLGTNPLSAPGSIVYYGDDPTTINDKSWVYFTTAGTPTPREARPVEIIRSYGESNGSLPVVEAEVKRIALNIATEGAVYAKDIITSNGSVTIDGNDSAGSGGMLAGTCSTTEPPKPPFYVCPADTTVELSGVANTLAGEGQPFNPVDYNNIPTDEFSGDIDIPVSEYVVSMGLPGAADRIVPAQVHTNPQWGEDGSGNSEITYCDATATTLTINNGGGYGLLAVKGDLKLGGSFTWHGLVLCTGTLTFSGGGYTGVNITGAVLANQTVTMSGSVVVNYDSCYIEEALRGMSAQVTRWRRVY